MSIVSECCGAPLLGNCEDYICADCLEHCGAEEEFEEDETKE